MLQSFDIKILADIRSMPGSRIYIQFNQQALTRSLLQAGIRYIHIPELGGRRKSPHGTDESGLPFYGYAAHMRTDEFRTGIEKLELEATTLPIAYMCAEAKWWECHRSKVSDHMQGKGWEVLHIMDIGKSVPHIYSTAVKPRQGDLFHSSKQDK